MRVARTIRAGKGRASRGAFGGASRLLRDPFGIARLRLSSNPAPAFLFRVADRWLYEHGGGRRRRSNPLPASNACGERLGEGPRPEPAGTRSGVYRFHSSPEPLTQPLPAHARGEGQSAAFIENFAAQSIPTPKTSLILPPPRQLAGASSGSAAPAGSVKRGTRPSFRAGLRRRPPGLSFVGRLRDASHAKAGQNIRARNTRPEYRKGKRRRAGGGACRGPCDALCWRQASRERSGRGLAVVPDGGTAT